MNRIEKYERIITSNQGTIVVLGMMGEGKTEMLEYIAKKNAWACEVVHLSTVDESDVGGLPRIDHANDQFVYAKPYWFRKAVDNASKGLPTLIIFDEINRCPLPVQNACLGLLKDRRLHGESVPDNVYFASAGNLGTEDGTFVEQLDPAMRDRLVFIKHKLNAEEWLEWAKEQNLNYVIRSYINDNPGRLSTYLATTSEKGADSNSKFATPRSWTFFSRFLSHNSFTGEKLIEAIEVFGPAYLGSVSQHLLTYTKNLLQKAGVNVLDILNKYDQPHIASAVANSERAEIMKFKSEIEEMDLHEMATERPKQFKNMVSFISDTDEEVIVSFVKTVLSDTKAGKGKHKHGFTPHKLPEAQQKLFKPLLEVVDKYAVKLAESDN